jgi:hypothetical protein
MPQGGKCETEDDEMPGELRRGQKLTESKKVGDTCYEQRDEERGCTPAAEVLSADRQCDKQQDAESAQPLRGCESHDAPER